MKKIETVKLKSIFFSKSSSSSVVCTKNTQHKKRTCVFEKEHHHHEGVNARRPIGSWDGRRRRRRWRRRTRGRRRSSLSEEDREDDHPKRKEIGVYDSKEEKKRGTQTEKRTTRFGSDATRTSDRWNTFSRAIDEIRLLFAVGAFTGVSLSNRDEATGKQNGSFIYSREYR